VAVASVFGRAVLLRAVAANSGAFAAGRVLLEALSGGVLILLAVLLYP